MSEYDELDEQDNEQQTPAGLRRAASKAAKLERENEQLQRELAFARAGITGTDQRTAIFMRGYDGDLTPEAIREVATEAGFLQQPQAQAPQQSAEAQQALAAERQAQAITAPSAQVGQVVDPEQRLEVAMNEGGIDAVLAEARSMGVPVIGGQ